MEGAEGGGCHGPIATLVAVSMPPPPSHHLFRRCFSHLYLHHYLFLLDHNNDIRGVLLAVASPSATTQNATCGLNCVQTRGLSQLY